MASLLVNKAMKGVITAMVAPFNKEGELDKKAIKEVVSFLKTKVHGLFVNGTYGSGPLMSTEERKRVLEWVMEEAAGHIQVCVNISSTTNKMSIELGKHAVEVNASSVITLAPYYYKHDMNIVEDYLNELMSTIEIPVFFYNNPAVVPFNATSSFLFKLAKKGLKGIKDSSFNILNFYDYLNIFEGTDFKCMIGTDALLLPSVIMGAWGCISAISNYLPDLVMKLWEETVKGNIEKATILQKKILRVRDIFKKSPTIPLIQKALLEIGINAGYPREPFKDTPVEIWNDIKYQLSKLGVTFR